MHAVLPPIVIRNFTSTQPTCTDEEAHAHFLRTWYDLRVTRDGNSVLGCEFMCYKFSAINILLQFEA